MAINSSTEFKVVMVTASALPTTKEEGAIYVWKNGLYLGTSASAVSMLGQVENVASIQTVTNPVAERYYVDTTDAILYRWTGSTWQAIGGSSSGSLTAQNFSISGKATAAAVAFDGTAAVELAVTALDASGLSGAIPATVTATTQAASDNSTKLATTAYVNAAVSTSIASVYRVKGSVDQVASDASHTGLDDPYANTENSGSYTATEGDVWNVTATGDNYVWVAGSPGTWDKLSGTVDLTNYVTLDSVQTISGAKTFSSDIIGSVTGNAATATALATTRAINISGDGITGTAQNFDGSADITVPITFTTQAASDNSTKPATTAYVDTAVTASALKWSVVE